MKNSYLGTLARRRTSRRTEQGNCPSWKQNRNFKEISNKLCILESLLQSLVTFVTIDLCVLFLRGQRLPRRGYELEDSETVDLLIEDKYSVFTKNETTKEEKIEDNLSEKEKEMISEVITHIRKCSLASLPEDLVKKINHQ